MNIGICDDDNYVVKYISGILQTVYNIKPAEIEMYNSGESILASKTEFNLVFLDIEMGKTNGITVGYELKKRYPNITIIIITSHNYYLDAAMDLHAFRFLEKPIDEMRLIRSLDLFFSDGNKTVTFTSLYKTISLFEKDIVCVYTQARKTLVVDMMSNKYETTLPLKTWCDTLLKNTSFAMPHNSFLVNLNFVSRIDKTTLIMRCSNGYEFEIYASRRKIGEFRDLFYRKMKERK